MPRLIIYKASAGSGKTFTLTQKYLELLFRDNSAFKRILAVTFTNKAAGEMKGRIIRELYLLSTGKDEAGHKPASMDRLCKLNMLSPQDVSVRAAMILDNILNDYSWFSVCTIDKFFQLIIRSFTRETGLQVSYNLELNDSKILDEAVDNLIFEMDENLILREWMIQYAEELIREGKSLNLKKEIINLGKEIFKENFMDLHRIHGQEAISDQKIRDYSRLLNGSAYAFENRMKNIGNDFLDIVQKYGLELNDFKGQSKSFVHYFKKITNPQKVDSYSLKVTARNAIDDPAAWYVAKSDKKDKILAAYNNGLNKLLKETNDHQERYHKEYLTVSVIRRFIYAFGILSDLSRHVRQITLERNLFLISDASQFLNQIIAENEAPFVYEKAGNYFKNFMLDEFQDTSVFQWKNFKPLIHNSLSEGFDNLVVGDVKQSIYRWRNSYWNILASSIANSFPDYSIDLPLRENWRSRENIIRFNNRIFKASAEILREKFINGFTEGIQIPDELFKLSENIISAYRESEQNMPGNRTGGYININFLQKGLKKEEIDNEIRRRLPSLILELQDRGYTPKDIAILVRTRSEGKQAASILLEYKNNFLKNSDKYNFNIISNDSLFVNSNPAVQMLSALMKYLVNRSDRINEAFIIHEYSRYLLSGRELPDDYHLIFNKTLQQHSQSFNMIYSDFIREYNNILQLSLFDLVEKLIRIFRLNENIQDLPYIQAFQEVVLTFMKNESTDVSSFIEFWENEGTGVTLNISEQQDAINIMTIHKAKGLEFRVVIIPFCNWTLDHDTRSIVNVLWCKTRTKPFDFLPFVPVNYSQKLAETYFNNEYHNERLLAYVDNLNLLYVSLTRAKDELHVFSSPTKENNNNFPVHCGDILLNILEKEKTGSIEKENMHLTQNISDSGWKFEYGQPDNYKSLTDQVDNTEEFDCYPVNPFPKNLRLKYRSEVYFSSEPGKLGIIDYGIVMHEILSRVKKKEDLDKSIETAFREGKIDPMKKQDIAEAFSTGFKKAIPFEMFQPGWKIFTERDILTPEGEYRPDRIMLRDTSAIIIDYKFGIEVRKSYYNQMLKYIRYVKETGFSSVKGYIWYFTLGKLEEVYDG